MRKYMACLRLSALEKLNGGILYLLPDVAVRILTLVPLVYLWRTVMLEGADVGMSLSAMLTYTYVSQLLSEQLVIKTPATGWLSDGVLLSLFGRPLSVIWQLVAQTVGGWTPMLLLFSLPMAALSPLVGVRLFPVPPLFWPSLLLCASLGFAVDFLFASVTIRLRNMTWLVHRIRMAIVALFSGTVIPIRLLPFGLAEAMRYQPFASMGGAPLSILVGTESAGQTLLLQLLWNACLWPAALLLFHHTRERMVSYGG